MNTSKTIIVTKTIKENLRALSEARLRIKEWEEWRLEAEAAILKEVQEQGVVFPEVGTLPVGDNWCLMFVKVREYVQGCLVEFVEKHPGIASTLFKVEWKPVSKEAIDSFLVSGHPAAEELTSCFKERANKPMFRAK